MDIFKISGNTFNREVVIGNNNNIDKSLDMDGLLTDIRMIKRELLKRGKDVDSILLQLECKVEDNDKNGIRKLLSEYRPVFLNFVSNFSATYLASWIK